MKSPADPHPVRCFPAFAPHLAGAFLAATVLVSMGAATRRDQEVERGRYLVHRVGLCIDCHSPRDERGQFIVDRHLTGSVLGFTPTAPMPWAPAAPVIAGLEGYTTDQAVKFLMTGERPGGVPPRPPMPEYRLNREDAEAVVAYLKSLKQESAPPGPRPR